MFASRLPLAERYADWLAGEGIVRGLIGPREAPRLWDRHLLNCALLGELVPRRARVVDLGSGAGLPGIPLAIARPDLHITLVEPLLRRTTFLDEVVADLGLTQVEVVRGRAEDLHGHRTFEVVTSRALAPLPKLLRWSLPLTKPGGAVLALKGGSARDEVESVRDHLDEWGGAYAEVVEIAQTSPPVTVVRVRGDGPAPVASGKRPGAERRSTRHRS